MDHAHAAAHDDIRHHVRGYFMVFGALMALTILTVGVSYLHLAVPMAIFVALVIAAIKASLVALVFMHLRNERRLIYSVLALTALFFLFLMFIPLFTNLDKIVQAAR